MKLNTHLNLDQMINGKVVELKENFAKIQLATTLLMKADEQGLVHGGFIFSSADFTAMATINHPHVVLAKSEVKFLAPVKVGEIVTFEGTVSQNDGRKATVKVVGYVADKDIFVGSFYTVVLDKHVLS